MNKKIAVNLLILFPLILGGCKGKNNENPDEHNNDPVKQYVLTVEGGESYFINQNDNILDVITNIPEKEGYFISSWTIDGVNVSAGTIFTFNSDKTIVPVFAPNIYSLSFTESPIIKNVTFDKPIGELPSIEEETGYRTYWVIDGVEITSETVWKYTEDKTAEIERSANKYELSFEELPETKLEVTFGKKIGELPEVPNTFELYSGYWKIDDKEINEDTIWTYDSNKTAKAAYIQLKDEFTTNPEDGCSISVNNDKVSDVWNNYSYGYSEKYRVNLADQYENKPLRISWDSENDYAYYRVLIGQKADLSDAISYIVFDSNLEIENAYTDTTYYYQIKAYDEKEDLKTVSMIRSVVVLEGPRTIMLDGVSNFRDIGGNVTTLEGKKIKQGMIYRSATIDSLSSSSYAESKSFFNNVLNIKTDFDLRNATETGGRISSPSGCPNYIHISGIYYTGGDFGINVGQNAIEFGKEMMIFADSNNYPIDFHCAIGRDRTGCLAAVLLGLLGVSYENICKDYELSFLSKAATQDGSKSGVVTSVFRPFLDYVISNGGTSGDLSEKITYFLTHSCGLSMAQINSIKSIMLEDK